jgi:hypothetical protein
VYSAGYLGSAIAGGILVLATLRYSAGRWVMGAAAVWLALMGLMYGRDPFTLLFCFGTSAAMGAGAKYLPKGAVDAVNLFIASFSALYAAFDLRSDLWDSAARAHTDAALLADHTLVPAIVWALLWSLASLAILGVFLWRAVQAPRHRVPLPRPAAVR